MERPAGLDLYHHVRVKAAFVRIILFRYRGKNIAAFIDNDRCVLGVHPRIRALVDSAGGHRLSACEIGPKPEEVGAGVACAVDLGQAPCVEQNIAVYVDVDFIVAVSGIDLRGRDAFPELPGTLQRIGTSVAVTDFRNNKCTRAVDIGPAAILQLHHRAPVREAVGALELRFDAPGACFINVSI